MNIIESIYFDEINDYRRKRGLYKMKPDLWNNATKTDPPCPTAECERLTEEVLEQWKADGTYKERFDQILLDLKWSMAHKDKSEAELHNMAHDEVVEEAENFVLGGHYD